MYYVQHNYCDYLSRKYVNINVGLPNGDGDNVMGRWESDSGNLSGTVIVAMGGNSDKIVYCVVLTYCFSVT